MKTPVLTLVPARPALRANADQTLDVLVRIEVPATDARGPRPPLNLALVIDRSGSMSGDKIRTARQVALAAMDRLEARDRFSVVTFESAVEVVVPSTPADRLDAARALVAAIEPGGMTALHGGWLEGGTQVARHLRPGHLNRVLLVSDGQANVGLTGPAEIARDVAGLAERGVSTTCFGIGDDYDERLLETMADAGDGNAHHVQHARDLEAMFHAELAGLSATVGRAVSLGIEPHPERDVRVQEVLNDLERTEFGRLKLTNLLAGRPIEVVLRLHVGAAAVPAPGGPAGLMRVRLAWNDPRDGERRTARAQLDLPVVDAATFERLPVHADVEARVAALEAARQRVQAVQALRHGDVAAARTAFAVAAAAPAFARFSDREDVRQELAELAELSDSLDRGETAETLKRASSQAYKKRRSKD